jgi:hypothetical protein
MTEATKQLRYIEAQIDGQAGMTGREWDVTLIGPASPEHLIQHAGREYIMSKNGGLYSVDALRESAGQWEGVKVYDNHLTDEEFSQRQGMRSPSKEWLGTIVNVTWDAAGRKLRGVFKVVEDALARKLRNAWDQGVINSIGLSIDAYAQKGDEVEHEGRRFPVVEAFKKITSVDLVSNPAAGGGFNRILAATHEENHMTDETVENQFVTKDELTGLISQAVADALAAKAEENEVEVDDLTDSQVEEALADRKVTEAEKTLLKLKRQAADEQRKTDLARTDLTVERKLDKAKLPEAFEAAVRAQFAGRVAEAEEIDKAIALQRGAYASLDPSGRVKAGGISDIRPGIDQDEKFELEFMRRIMGNTAFDALHDNQNSAVKERLTENRAYQSWLKQGKPVLPSYNRLSSLLWEYFGGDPTLDNRAMEAVTTSTLATVVKNTVNIMTAANYSKRELWFEPIVRVEEVDTIDDATLARTYGVSSLSTVNEGAAYTELAMQDEEETASFVKRGNYIGVTLELLMRDKIGEIRRIPEKLANAWYNTQSDLVSAVFTTNTAAGPVLGTTGALFNNTATSSAGGHANLLTTALGYAAFGAARTAMRKQTDQPLGAGRKLLIEPRYLLVPVDLETTALNIRNSELQPDADFDSGAVGSGAQSPNQYRGKFEVIVVPTWTDVDNWALVGDPNQYPAIWLIYPRGQRTPQIFSADGETGGAMFTNDELRFKVRLMTYRFSSTYDCAPVSDFRPLHKSNV